MRVVIVGTARKDLRDIALYIAEHNPVRAMSYVSELREACLSLADKPLRFGLLPGHEDRDLRIRPHGRYVIIYSVRTDRVLVHRVVNAALDRSNVVIGISGVED